MASIVKRFTAICGAILMICGLLASCGSEEIRGGYSSPEAAAKAYMQAFMEEDADAGLEAVYPGLFSSSVKSYSKDDFRSGFLYQAGKYSELWDKSLGTDRSYKFGRTATEELNESQIDDLFGVDDLGKTWKQGEVISVSMEIIFESDAGEKTVGASMVVGKDDGKWYALFLTTIS